MIVCLCLISCGVSERRSNQRRICRSEGHREQSEAIPGNPLRTPPGGASPPGRSPGSGALGRRERRDAPAPGVRTARSESCLVFHPLFFDLARMTSHFVLTPIPTGFPFHRCIQDPDVLVNVSQTMSLQYTPTEVSEDCLYLNVYAPAEAKRGHKLPVGV